ncbi:homoserine kinase [Salipiger sp. IMCC34102]|uniref:phosphotransferase enzyme family protein n=1 Tax=Salipiger sp. IMCC34102 TaxID=2510647 RepID=UPI00101CB791|nr:phosphotransferase [Salipiger sp. IMCC34102]RYH02637.1 homoserine kinase [Salipiger sp. IMCC34102]
MSGTLDRALSLWGLSGAEARLIAARENAVYRVTRGGTSLALRLHRTGYRSDAELASELDWMAAVAAAGIGVPAPVPASDGALLHVVDGVQVDVLTWLEGETLAEALDAASPDTRRQLFAALGAEMARLHAASDAWTPPPGFRRCRWDRDGLLGEMPLWDRFWRNPGLTTEDRALFEAFRTQAHDALGEDGAEADTGLIHADLVAANVLVGREGLALIDFDDGGYGYRLFDIATALFKHMTAPDYPALKAALLESYTDLRGVDLSRLDLFLALRAATYVGWNITRRAEDPTGARNRRFIDQARPLLQHWIDHRRP